MQEYFFVALSDKAFGGVRLQILGLRTLIGFQIFTINHGLVRTLARWRVWTSVCQDS